MVLLHLYATQLPELQKLEQVSRDSGYFTKTTNNLETIEKLFTRPETHIITFLVGKSPQAKAAVRTLLKKQLKRSHAHGIIIISNSDDLAQKLNWFDLGIDAVMNINDIESIFPVRSLALYRRISKNFNFLCAKVNQTPLLQLVDNSHVFIKNQLIRLTPAEYRILQYLISTAHRIISRNELSTALRLSPEKSRSLFNVHMHNLREKFARAGISAIITTKAGAGYQFNYQSI